MKFLSSSEYILSTFAVSGLLFLTSCNANQEPSDPKFLSGEHQLIGNEGFAKACSVCVESVSGIVTKEAKYTLNYGQIVAFSGDFFGSPEELDNAKKSSNAWLGYSGIENAKELFSSEIHQIQAQLTEASAEIDDYNTAYTLNFPTTYLELAKDNSSHFGWENMKNYVFFHSRALDLAMQSYESKDPEEKAELRRLAILNNGFADHFLTDGFAAGHIRVPRLQGMIWAKENINNFLDPEGQVIGGILAKILHDDDHSFVSSEESGLPVMNAQGDRWLTRSDGDLFKAAGTDFQSQDYIRLVSNAVELSVREILSALNEGQVPEGIYAATKLVPFIDPQTPGIDTVFPSTMSDEDLDARIKAAIPSWIPGGLSIWFIKDHARRFLMDLPQVMADFRAQIASETEELKDRVPPEYIEGYLNVR